MFINGTVLQVSPSQPRRPLMTPLKEEDRRATSKFIWGNSNSNHSFSSSSTSALATTSTSSSFHTWPLGEGVGAEGGERQERGDAGARRKATGLSEDRTVTRAKWGDGVGTEAVPRSRRAVNYPDTDMNENEEDENEEGVLEEEEDGYEDDGYEGLGSLTPATYAINSQTASTIDSQENEERLHFLLLQHQRQQEPPRRKHSRDDDVSPSHMSMTSSTSPPSNPISSSIPPTPTTLDDEGGEGTTDIFNFNDDYRGMPHSNINLSQRYMISGDLDDDGGRSDFEPDSLNNNPQSSSKLNNNEDSNKNTSTARPPWPTTTGTAASAVTSAKVVAKKNSLDPTTFDPESVPTAVTIALDKKQVWL